MNIGVLALQGAFAEHIGILENEGLTCFEIRKKSDIPGQKMDGLILPGGESTVMRKLLVRLDLLEPLQEMIRNGLPVLGTCAGLILLAKRITGGDQPCFACMDTTVRRNAYGRQLGSFEVIEEFVGIGLIPMTFIRGPYIESAGKNVDILARVDEKIVAARQGNMLVTAFHPELTDNRSVHRYFLDIVRNNYREAPAGRSA